MFDMRYSQNVKWGLQMVGLLLLGAFVGFLGAATAIYLGAGFFGAFLAYSGAGFVGTCLAAIPIALRQEPEEEACFDYSSRTERSDEEKHARTMSQWNDDPDSARDQPDSDSRAA